MAVRIEVGLKPELEDPAGKALEARILGWLSIQSVKSVRVIDVYSFEDELSEETLVRLAEGLFADPITQIYSINLPLAKQGSFDFAIIISLRPGVKDNTGDAAKEACEDFLGKKLAGRVCSSKQYLIRGKIGAGEAERIARELLANELIHHLEVKSAKEFASAGFGSHIPKVDVAGGGMVCEIELPPNDRALAEISRKRLLALSVAEMRAIRAYYQDPDTAFQRKRLGLPACPTDAELECIAQTWSEHCKHKIFNAKIKLREGGKAKLINSLFKSFIRAATEKLRRKKKWLVSVFADNAGVFELVEGWNVAMKVETHNTPSALDPFGGALTGILGVNRDILGCGLGAKPIFNTDVFCFAEPSYTGEIPPRLFHPRRVLEGVRAGVAHGGNASGIPTINGAIVFDNRYLGKPIVYCGTGGLMPAVLPDGRKSHEKRAQPGDRIFMAGGKIGKDGIHGATFSSEELHEGSPVSAVQLGDPYTQKKLSDFLLEARDRGLFNAVTDNGAGGLSSSVGEMAQGSGGAVLHLDRAPLKYPGLDPWEILLSESQERMTFAVPPSKAGDFVQLARLRGVEVCDLGHFDSSGFFHVLYGAKTVCYLDMEFLHSGVPQLELEAELRQKKLSEPASALSQDLGAELLSLLSRPNICSKEYVIRQYDHEVQGGSVGKPLCGKSNDGPSDGGVVAPFFDRKEGIVVSNGICPRYSDIDAYQMAANALDEAVRNYVACGGSLERLAALDNFCWADPVYSSENPEGRHRLAQLVLTCKGLYDGCIAYGIPLISGKDSMKNDYRHGRWKISIPPTLLVSAVGRIDDVSLSVSSDFKQAGDCIYLLGETRNELGGSEYYAMKGILGANVPKVNFKKNLALYRRLERAIKKRLVASCHDCSEGGLAVALAESCIGGRLGAKIDLSSCAGGLTCEQALFSESAGRFVVSIPRRNERRFKSAMRGSKAQKIGEVSKDGRLSVSMGGRQLFSLPISALVQSWKKTMDW
ncbi:MAG: phosphoribosylformylglycinamidine synthase subunit PurS [Candidatus Micrarchaeota archaeon]|nr:phosphoribosylformylglycinamidine synthase subunit PurS [Candidatus Micrarchaeota archaeon]